jgi:hypothetical protein
MRRLVTVLAAVCLLALPSAALAQNAGDEQYNDPFSGVDENAEPQDNGSSEEPAATPAPAQTSDAPAGTESESTQETAAPALPRTGLPVLILAAGGALLLAGGTTLRRRTS